MWRKNRVKNSGSSCRGVDLNRNFGFHWAGKLSYISITEKSSEMIEDNNYEIERARKSVEKLRGKNIFMRKLWSQKIILNKLWSFSKDTKKTKETKHTKDTKKTQILWLAHANLLVLL